MDSGLRRNADMKFFDIIPKKRYLFAGFEFQPMIFYSQIDMFKERTLLNEPDNRKKTNHSLACDYDATVYGDMPQPFCRQPS
jgi:hypothetical protein